MDIQLTAILFQIINFGVVLGALTVLLYKPIVKTLQKRAEKIEESQKAADQVLREKEEMESTKKMTLSEAKKDAAGLMATAKDEVDSKKKVLMEKAKSEVKEYLEEEKKKWEAEKKQLAKQMETEFKDAVFSVTETILGKNVLDTKAHAKLIDQSISEIVKAM